MYLGLFYLKTVYLNSINQLLLKCNKAFIKHETPLFLSAKEKLFTKNGIGI